LAVSDRPQHRASIASALWLGSASERAAATLRTALWQSRELIDDCIHIEGNCLSIAAGVDALECLCHKLSAAGRPGEAIEAGLAAIAAEPLREGAQRTLICVDRADGT
jgi:hypothetical protein